MISLKKRLIFRFLLYRYASTVIICFIGMLHILCLYILIFGVDIYLPPQQITRIDQLGISLLLCHEKPRSGRLRGEWPSFRYPNELLTAGRAFVLISLYRAPIVPKYIASPQAHARLPV